MRCNGDKTKEQRKAPIHVFRQTSFRATVSDKQFHIKILYIFYQSNCSHRAHRCNLAGVTHREFLSQFTSEARLSILEPSLLEVVGLFICDRDLSRTLQTIRIKLGSLTHRTITVIVFVFVRNRTTGSRDWGFGIFHCWLNGLK